MRNFFNKQLLLFCAALAMLTFAVEVIEPSNVFVRDACDPASYSPELVSLQDSQTTNAKPTESKQNKQEDSARTMHSLKGVENNCFLAEEVIQRVFVAKKFLPRKKKSSAPLLRPPIAA